MPKKTFFGFTEINEEDKESLVGDVFAKVAPQYDIMNDAMSLGVHRLWKDKFIKMLNPAKNTKLLDVAGGTGDIAFRFLKATQESEVTICDINKNMLDEGKKNAIDNNLLGNNIDWLCANAENLPVADNSYDYYTIAFGIRNVTNIDKALKEAYRILKPGGKFMCLEFSKVSNPLISSIYDFYSFNIIPKMGKVISNDSESYKYLVESIRKFPSQENFTSMIEDANFEKASYFNMNFGMVAIHSGWKI